VSDAEPRRFTERSRGDASDIDGQLVRASERARTSQTPYSSHQMSVLGIGVDVIECARIQHSMERFGDRFLHRVFTDGEIEYSMSMKFPERHLAARFAGKEAVSKAFGTGIGKAMTWRNIDIRKKESGEPFLLFSGPAEAFAAKRGVTSALITLSHTENYAVACVVLEG
jgi:holo-[acyl-carrier protein] synthase